MRRGHTRGPAIRGGSAPRCPDPGGVGAHTSPVLCLALIGALQAGPVALAQEGEPLRVFAAASLTEVVGTLGGSFGGAKGRTHVPQLVDMYVRGELALDPFVSHRLKLDDVNKGFDLMHEQDGIRSVIQFS